MGSDDLFKKRREKRLKRKIGNRGQPKDSFLIVCEGTKTEPNYFDAFRVKTASIQVVGLGVDPLSLVHETIKLKQKEFYDQIWCVFDRDNFPIDNILTAFELADSNNIKIAYSNAAFELWYLLHFHYYNTAMDRADYKDILTSLLGFKYEKSTENMYEYLLEYQDRAIKLAEKLLLNYDYPDPIKNNPQTTVHMLVQQLNRFK